VGLERGPLSLVSTTEELLERKNNGSGLENRQYGRKQKLALISPTSGGRSVGIFRSRTENPVFGLVWFSATRRLQLVASKAQTMARLYAHG
jgi:hypothetical protein